MFQPFIDNPFLGILAILVAVLGPARLARVVTYDDFPPAMWLRKKVVRALAARKRGDWAKIATCFWCFTPWVVLASMGWFILGLVVPWIGVLWWVSWGWLALSYLASWWIARDEPAGD